MWSGRKLGLSLFPDLGAGQRKPVGLCSPLVLILMASWVLSRTLISFLFLESAACCLNKKKTNNNQSWAFAILRGVLGSAFSTGNICSYLLTSEVGKQRLVKNPVTNLKSTRALVCLFDLVFVCAGPYTHTPGCILLFLKDSLRCCLCSIACRLGGTRL